MYGWVNGKRSSTGVKRGGKKLHFEGTVFTEQKNNFPQAFETMTSDGKLEENV